MTARPTTFRTITSCGMRDRPGLWVPFEPVSPPTERQSPLEGRYRTSSQTRATTACRAAFRVRLTAPSKRLPKLVGRTLSWPTSFPARSLCQHQQTPVCSNLLMQLSPLHEERLEDALFHLLGDELPVVFFRRKRFRVLDDARC